MKILATAALAAALAAPASAAPSRVQSVLDAINAARVDARLRPLQLDLPLERAAQAQSVRVAQSRRLAHGDTAGRLRAFGARGPVYAENLALVVGLAPAPRLVVRMWLRSPRHRANLLRPGFSRIGIGSVGGVVTADFAGS